MSEANDGKYCYQYPHPAVTVDCIIFALHENDLKVLLIQRLKDPYKECWAFPGGFVEIDEGIEEGARRELEEETGVKGVFLEQLYTFGDPRRDPRERIITVAYYSLVQMSEHKLRAASDAMNACWWPVHRMPPLAFDHKKIMETAFKRLQGKVLYAPVIFELLPAKFRLADLQHVYEIILERPLDRRNFCKTILASGILTPLKEFDRRGRVPAPLYKFDKKKFQKKAGHGFVFEIKPDGLQKKSGK
ncbi:MAG: NUDIX hydrolase [Verrucomicrobia bacterium]|nr:NUDIX hydrolase [Verrucomicrobiota bacterium]